ncbi:hypothetical protein GH5_08451 [Leishmania sp. Ghana 2012 LV757]|uniref:hypothetical protein n=1 Tax=Leishmania sp. Ghana 2012 LV757 TaxID=2803181 RepID=UPI001B3E93B4|nr:hypothetical protein GH5_08451 [Leishmania sp. Ghana 2012 LV757]
MPVQFSSSSAVKFNLKRVASVDTPLTCNCLLAASLSPPSASGDSPTPCSAAPESAAVRRPALGFLAASYELTSSSPSTAAPAASEVDDGADATGPRHIGECAFYQYVATGDGKEADGSAVQVRCCTSALPGVFDLVSMPSSFFSFAAPFSASNASPCIVMACTDGSVRVLDPSTLSPVVDPLRGVHERTLTSCTALCCPAPHLLCSAHTGAVFLYSLAERRVTRELEGHEYDAWCTAMLPTGGWWSAAPAHPHANGSCSDSDDTGNEAGTAHMPTGASTSVLLASGGDDGYCKLYDIRANPSRAVNRLRFDAGVVSITPVLDTTDGLSAAHTTPYLLVGSYDGCISLIDVRRMRCPVAQRSGLGGGVWRTSRCLLPLWDSGAAVSDDVGAVLGDNGDVNLSLLLATATTDYHRSDVKRPCATHTITSGWVNTTNVLVLPLMQRGAALLPYNVRASAEGVFGSADVPLTYFYGDASYGDSEAALTPALTDSTLVYDAAVLRPLDWADLCGADRSAAAVATVSFYERRIDVWAAEAVPQRV